MITDAQGHALTGATNEAAAHYEQAVTAFNLYRGDPMAALDRALEAAPAFAMAHLLKAHLLAIATEPAAAAAGRELLQAIADLPMNERERSHRAAIALILRGEWTAAAIALDMHQTRHPFDIVSLQVGHLCDFFRASARHLRDRIARTLPHWSAALAALPALTVEQLELQQRFALGGACAAMHRVVAGAPARSRAATCMKGRTSSLSGGASITIKA